MNDADIKRCYFNKCSIVTIAAACCRQSSESSLYRLSPTFDILFKGKMSSNICACSNKENHGESYEMTVIGENAETAPNLKDISNQLTEKPKECEHAEQVGEIKGRKRAEQVGEIKGLETKTTGWSDEEKGGTTWDGPEIWSDIALNEPDEVLEASDRATWLVVEKGRLICRSMSPNPYSGWPRPYKENGNEIHEEKK